MFQFYSKSNRTVSQHPERSLFNDNWKKISERFGSAICVPSKCSSKVVRKILQHLMNGTEYKVADDFDQNDFCKTVKLVKGFSKSFIIFAFTTITLLTCVTLSTVYDLSKRNYNKDKRINWLLTFSAYTNASNLFNINKTSTSDTIQCLNGIRFLSAISIVLLHANYHRAMFPVQNSTQVSSLEQSFYGRTITGLNVSVDTFFVISGLLVTRSILKDLDA